MDTTFMDKEQKRLIKKFYTLLSKLGGNVTKEAILSSYGVESSKDLSVKELIDICNKLSVLSDPKYADLDKWRKRVIAVIFSYCKLMGRSSGIPEIKAIACRASGYMYFNEIPAARLSSIYNAFNQKSKDLKKITGIANEDLLNNFNLN